MQNLARAVLKFAENGATKAVIEMCEARAPVNASDKDGWTPLMFAAAYGDKDMVRALLKAGAEVNAEVADGWYEGETALIVAARNGHEDVVAELIKHGANVDAKRKDVGFARQREVSRKRREEKKRQEERAAQKRKKNGQTEVAFFHEQYVKQFDPFEWADEHLAERRSGYTPLMFAAALDHKGIVEKLLAAGADVNARDDNGDTALRIALGNKSKNAAAALSLFSWATPAKAAEDRPPIGFPVAPGVVARAGAAMP